MIIQKILVMKGISVNESNVDQNDKVISTPRRMFTKHKSRKYHCIAWDYF